MSYKPVPVGKFVCWLESKGLIYIRTESSHDHYNYPERDPRRLTRPVTIRLKFKEIPAFHIHTNLQTMGIEKKDFWKEIRQF